MGQQRGSLISLVGGLLFILLNTGRLAAPLPVVLRVVGVVVALVVLAYAVVAMPRRTAGTEAVPPGALRVYLICVAAEVVAIPLGAQVLVHVLHRPSLTPLWVVFVVGVHFLPFASAFRVPLFGWLGGALVLVAVVGTFASSAVGPVAVDWAGVTAGFLLLAFALISGWQERRRIAPAGG